LKSLLFTRWPVVGLSLAALLVLASCNLAGELPEGPVTPIVPPPTVAATRAATLTAAPSSVPGTAAPIAQPTARATGQGAIAGTLVNGTAGEKSPGNLALTLYAVAPDRSAIMFTRTVTSDAGGEFVFDQLDPSPMTLYAVQAEYLKANYFSDLLTFAHGGLTLTVPITVYETTTDASALRVEQMHLFFEFAPGRATVSQLSIVSNLGDRAYIAADGVSARFPLPSNATNVSFEDGVLGGRYQPVAGGFADTEAVLPGVGATQILFSYDVPYDGKKLDLNLTTAYPVRSVNVLAPEGGVQLSSAQLSAAGTRATQGGNMLNFVGGSLAAGQSLALQLSGAPAFAPTEASAEGVSPLLIASAILLLAAAGIVAFVWLRQQRAASELAEVEDVDARREELLDAIAALDDDFEVGRVRESDYRRERATLKAELVELTKDE